MKRLEGGYLGGRPTWSLASNPGIWGIEQVYARRAAGTWPAGGGSFDEYYEYVTFMLHADGANASTSFPDSSLYGLAVTVTGNAQVSTAQSKFGGASILFDGNGDYLTASSSTAFLLGSQNFTIECWVRLASTSGTQTILSTADPTDGQGFYLGCDVGNFFFLAGAGGTWSFILTAGVSVVNTWQHICVVRNGNTFTTYLDGVQQASTTNTISLTNTNNQLRIGGRTVASQWFNGYIDDLRITKGYARYTSNFSVPTGPYEDEGAPLADPFYNYVSLLLPMNGSNNSTTFTDKSPNALTVTANGDAKLSTAVKRYWTSSAAFDGTGDYLTAPSSTVFDLGTDYTIEFWVYPAITPNYNFGLVHRAFYSTVTSNWTGLAFSIRCLGSSGAGNLRFYFYATTSANEQVINTTGSLSAGRWTHIAMTRVGTTGYAFVDGVLVGTVTSLNTPAASSQALRIGRWDYNAGNEDFNGYIDDLRITKGVARYTANFIPPLPHADYGTLADPYLAASTLWMPMEGPVNSTGFFDRAKRLPATTYGNAKISNAQYKWGLTSAAFDGAGDYVTIQDSDGLNFGSGDFTIEMWVYSTAANPNATYLYSKRTSNTFASVVILFANSTLRLFASGDGSTWGVDFTSTSGITQNTWTHVAFTRSGPSWRMFFNGNQVGAQTASVTPTTTTAPVVIGADNSGGTGGFFAGYIDDLRIIKGHARYTTNFTPPTAPINADTSSDPYLSNVSLLLKMDGANNSTTFTDSSLTPNAVFANGNAKISTAQSKFGGASALLDGTGDYLSLAHNAEFSIESSDFTLEAWIYVSASNVLQNILNKRVNTPTQSGWGWRITAANALQFFHIGGSSLISTSTISSGTWTHIAVTRSGSTVRQFINGILDATTATFSNGVSNTQELRIGIDEGAADGFNGYIDDLRITKGVARYTSNFLPPTIGHPVWNVSSMDPDAATYITAVEAADAQALEDPVKIAIDQFVRGCKYDNIWTAIKACCILAGARTLNGALVPLVGTAPTNYNFVAGDYNRETGLGGDASNTSKYVDTNRAGNADPQNSKHAAVYMTATGFVLFGDRSATTGTTYLDTGGVGFRCRINTALITDDATLVLNNGLVGGSRSSSSAGTRRANGTNYSITTASQTPQANSLLLFARRNNTTGAPESFSAPRLAFYSIGESLDLAKLDTRVTALVAAIGAAIA